MTARKPYRVKHVPAYLAQHAYPGRIAAVIIHKVTSPVSPDRVAGMHLVDDYAQAAAVLLRVGVLDEAAALRVMLAARSGGLDISSAEIDSLVRANQPSEPQ